MYPTIEQVQAADVRELLSWQRFLPSPADDTQAQTLNLIGERLSEERAKDNAAYVVASKALSR
jgi:hypothetical protein